MPPHHARRLAIAWALILAIGPPAMADRPPPVNSIRSPLAESRHLASPRPGAKGSDPSPVTSGGWWFGPAGIALALAAVGGASVASKRWLPARDTGPIRVVGRASLSPRQSVYLVRVGDRVLILGAGTQGPPSALGEVTDPAELARLIPRRDARPAPSPVPSPGFDRRIGGDE